MSCDTHPPTTPLTPPQRRIGSIGIGTFLLIFFGILYILVCCFGSLLKKPGFLYCWSTIFFATLVIFLFTATRSPREKPANDVNDDKDQLYNVRLFLGISLCLCCCWSCCFYTQAHLARPFEVKGVEVEMGEQEAFTKSRPMF